MFGKGFWWGAAWTVAAGGALFALTPLGQAGWSAVLALAVVPFGWHLIAVLAGRKACAPSCEIRIRHEEEAELLGEARRLAPGQIVDVTLGAPARS